MENRKLTYLYLEQCSLCVDKEKWLCDKCLFSKSKSYIEQLERMVHFELSIDYNGSNYHVIFGRCENGAFFSIPNHGVGGDLANSSDTFWNAESIGMALNNHDVGKAIAYAIAQDMEV